MEINKTFAKYPGYHLFVTGGRLHNIAKPHDLRHQALVDTWMNDPNHSVSALGALESGHLAFTPGQWWMHPIFAFHDGIIDSPDSQGGITADPDGVYAITLTGNDEVHCTETSLTYRCHTGDHGCHCLLRGILPPKQSIRVLRCHDLHSPWSPSAGVRYEGLYKLSGYSVRNEKGDNQLIITATLHREPNQMSMQEVLNHPTTEEVDDFVEWRRLKHRNAQDEDDFPASL